MTAPFADLQVAVVQRLRASPGVTNLVPADAIFDGFAVPQVFPAIVLGEDQASELLTMINRPEGIYDVVFPLSAWTRSSGLLLAKRIAGAIVAALVGDLLVGNQHAVIHFRTARFARDADGKTQRAVVVLRTSLMGPA